MDINIQSFLIDLNIRLSEQTSLEYNIKQNRAFPSRACTDLSVELTMPIVIRSQIQYTGYFNREYSHRWFIWTAVYLTFTMNMVNSSYLNMILLDVGYSKDWEYHAISA